MEKVHSTGFATPQECLVHQEKVYANEVAGLPELSRKNPVSAKKQAEYLEGWIVGTRDSLRSLAGF